MLDSPVLIICNSVIRLSTLVAQDLTDEGSNRFRLFRNHRLNSFLDQSHFIKTEKGSRLKSTLSPIIPTNRIHPPASTAPARLGSRLFPQPFTFRQTHLRHGLFVSIDLLPPEHVATWLWRMERRISCLAGNRPRGYTAL